MSNNLSFTISADTKEAQASLVALVRSFQSLKTAANCAGSNVGGVSGIDTAVKSAVGSLATLTAQLYTAKQAADLFFGAFKKGIAANAETETTTLGLKALISSLFEVRDATGQVAKGQEALAISGEEAKRQLDLLRVAGMSTSAEFADLAQAFKTALGTGAGAGLNVDQIRKLTVGLVQAAGVFNLAGDQLQSEIRAVLSGDQVENSTLATNALQLTGEQIKQFREQGTLYEELNRRLQTYIALSDEAGNTWGALLSNLNDGLSKFLGNASSGAFASIKSALRDAFTATVNIETGEVSDDLQGLQEAAGVVFDVIGELLADAIRGGVAVAKELSEWFEQNELQVRQLVDAFMAVLGVVGRAIGSVIQLVAKLLGATVETGALASNLNNVAVIVAGIDDAFRVVVGSIGVLGGAIIATVLEPLKSVAALIDKVAGTNFADLTSKAQSAAIEWAKSAKEYAKSGLERAATKAVEADIAARARNTFAATDPRRLDGGGRIDNTKTAGSTGGTVGAGRKTKTTDDKKDAAAKKEADDLKRSLEQLQKAREEAADKEFAARQERLRAELDKEVALGTKTKQEEIAARLALEQAAVNRERQLATAKLDDLKGKLAAAKTDAEKNGIQAQIEKADGDLKALTDKERTITLKAEVDVEKAKEAARDLVAEITNSIGDLTGDLEAGLRRAEQKQAKLLKDERVRGNAELERLVNEQARLEQAKARYDAAEKRFQRAVTETSQAEQDIDNKYESGAINILEKEALLREARLKNLDVLQQQVDAMKQLAEQTGNVDLKQQAQAAQLQLDQLRTKADETSKQTRDFFKSELGNAFSEILKSTGSLTKAIEQQLLQMLINVLQRQADKYLSAFLDDVVSGLAGAAKGGSGGSGWGGLIASGLQWLGFADGGHVRGPGTGTSDSILARLSNGEFVVKASAVRSLGVDTLRYLNAYGRLPMFNAGGLVEASGGMGTTVDNAISVAPRVTVSTSDIIQALEADPEFERFHVRLSLANKRRLS